MNANDYDKGIIYEDEYLYCLAIVFNELVSTDVRKTDMSGCLEEKLYMTQKAFCIMFRNKHYQLHYKFLSTLMRMQKHELTKRNIPSYEHRLSNLTVLPGYQDMIKDIESMISMPLISAE
jgi:hypothetical protein